jgi:hypothetical protein
MENCYTFDASTGEITPDIQLERHMTLQVVVEEHNHEKKKIRACPHNPPKNFCKDSLMLKTGGVENGHLVHAENPKDVLLHVKNSHKIKAPKESQRDVTIHGSRVALVRVAKGHGVTIHNNEGKWNLYVDRKNLSVAVSPTQ